MQQGSEGGCLHDLFADGDLAVLDHDALDAVGGTLVREAGARDQFIGGRQVAQGIWARGAVERFAHGHGRKAGKPPDRPHDVGMRLIRLIKHSAPGGPATACEG